MQGRERTWEPPPSCPIWQSQVSARKARIQIELLGTYGIANVSCKDAYKCTSYTVLYILLAVYEHNYVHMSVRLSTEHADNVRARYCSIPVCLFASYLVLCCVNDMYLLTLALIIMY